MFSNTQKVHFIGIGGAGMSGLAHVLNKQGKTVSGSDAKGSAVTERLQNEGIKVFIGHNQGQVADSEVVVLSTAISKDNVEYQEAIAADKKIVHRSDIMAYIVNSKQGIAVAGAHGKTTTTSMIACIAADSDLDPTYLVGGDVPLLAGNAHLGQGKFAITEADESDGSFLKLNPYIAVVTNIENDHMDYYKTKSNIDKAFAQFLDNVRPGGIAIVCFDNQDAKNIAQASRTDVVSYAIDSQADFQAKNIVYHANGTTYELFNLGNKIADITLCVPGKHNVLNSLAAIIASMNMGITLKHIQASLAKFTGAKRRFEVKYKSEGITVVDDYAHHPTEITTTLKAALQTQPERLICVFQPHRYTRTQLLFQEFTEAFVDADILIMADIYAASEPPLDNVNSFNLVQAIKDKYNTEVFYIANLQDIPSKLQEICKTGDLIMTMGAGNVYTVAEKLAEILGGQSCER